MLDKLFTEARTFHGWKDQPIADEILQKIYDLVKMAPTCVNGAPARFLFVRSKEEKERLACTVLPKNVEKTRTAPITVIIAEDLHWYEQLPHLMPHADYYSHFARDLELSRRTSFRNSSLQGGYFILAARALGLDCGPMSGFDNSKVDELFFAGTAWRSNFLCNLGYGDPAYNFPRLPRLGFGDACRIV